MTRYCASPMSSGRSWPIVTSRSSGSYHRGTLIAPDAAIRPPTPVPDTNQPSVASRAIWQEMSRESEENPVEKVSPAPSLSRASFGMAHPPLDRLLWGNLRQPPCEGERPLSVQL